MISRTIRIQLVAFVVLAVVGIAYAGANYAGLARLFTATTYTVRMELTDSGGIFTNAEVTYRGVDVGRVGALRPTANGAEVDLVIRRSAPAIPAEGLRAEVKNLSVIGELYVDLTPAAGSGPYLHDGSVIAAVQTRTPVPPAQLLSGLNKFVASVPAESTQTVLDEMSKAFGGGGQDLGRLLDSSSVLLDAAQRSVEQTTRLIEDGSVVLRTQNRTAGSITSFSRNLKLLAAQLAVADPALNRLITAAPLATTQLSDLLRESGPGFSRLISDLLTTSRLMDPRGAALRQLLITYPALARAAYSAVPGDGTVHFGLVLNAFDPLPCTKGYESTVRHPGNFTGDTPVNTQATCAEPYGSPIDVRGTQNVPHQPIPGAVPYPSTSGYDAAPTTAPRQLAWGPQPTWAQSPADILTGGGR